MNILDFLEEDQFDTRQISSTEYACSCPWCGGDDRFRVWPGQGESGRYWCRRCEQQGDLIQYLRTYRGLSFTKSRQLAGCENKLDRKNTTAKKQAVAPKKKQGGVIRNLWKEKIRILVDYAVKLLWSSPNGKEALDWLKENRLLTEATIDKARLGFLPEDQWRARSEWGLPPAADIKGNEKELWVPGGIIIPKFDGDDPVGVRVRRLDYDWGPKYAIISGSDKNPMWLKNNMENPTMVIESEFDAMLLNQEVGHLVNPMALGSVSIKPSNEMKKQLHAASRVMVALDNDSAGVEQTWKWWRKNFSNFSRAVLPKEYGKDPCDAMFAGLDLRKWVRACISLSGGLDAEEILKKYGVECQFVDDDREAARIVRELKNADTLFGLDIETAKHPDYMEHDKAGLEPTLSKIRTIQISDGVNVVFVFDMYSCKMKTLAPILKAKKFVAHNSLFDMKHLMAAGVDVQIFDCTMLAGNALRGGRYSLDYLVESCLNIRMSKKMQVSDWNQELLTEDQIMYAACDALLVFHLYELLEPLMYEYCRKNIYDLMRNAQKAVAELELNGIYFNTEQHAELISQWETEVDEASTAIAEIVGEGLNINSSSQLSGWLKENLDEELLQQLPCTTTGQIQTTAEALSKISSHPLYEPLMKFKHYKKLLSSFGTSYSQHIDPVTGRMHGNFGIAATTTGRFACHKPNIQNPPRDKAFRGLFQAEPGFEFIRADYGQIQLRIIAMLSMDRKMLKAYKSGDDLHRLTAAAVAGVPPEEVTKEQRQMAKAANFGSLFGQGVKSFKLKAENDYGIKMTDVEAKRIKDKFFRNYPGLKRWQKETAKFAAIEQRVTTPSGRVRDFSREPKGYSYSEALCTPVQGGEAEVLLAALGLKDQFMKGLDVKLVNIIHDELIFEVVEGDTEKAMVAIEEMMIAGMLQIFPNASTIDLVEAYVGKNWAQD